MVLYKKLCNFIIILFLILFFLLNIPTISTAATANIEKIDNNTPNITLKISSNKKIKSVSIYKKDSSGKYIKFYKSLSTESTEKVCTISSSRLSY